ncbi:MAG: hypothetical protein IM620_02405 [Cytophagales bacterium]|nr:hypothetical protein [Cytophagales bacterium]
MSPRTMIETRTIRPCFAVICCYASMGRHERWRGALLAEGLEVGRERGSRAAQVCAPQAAPLCRASNEA